MGKKIRVDIPYLDAVIVIEKDFNQKRAAGEYDIKYNPVPKGPTRPACLSKRLEECTKEEIEEAFVYSKAKDTHARIITEFNRIEVARTVKIQDQWFSDMMGYHGLNPKHPMVSAMYNYAEEHGHSAGLDEIACVFSGLVEFYKVAVKHGMRETKD